MTPPILCKCIKYINRKLLIGKIIIHANQYKKIKRKIRKTVVINQNIPSGIMTCLLT